MKHNRALASAHMVVMSYKKMLPKELQGDFESAVDLLIGEHERATDDAERVVCEVTRHHRIISRFEQERAKGPDTGRG